MEQANEPLTFHTFAADGLRHCLNDGHELTPYGSSHSCGDCPICGAHWYYDPGEGAWLSVGIPEDCRAHSPAALSSQPHLVA